MPWPPSEMDTVAALLTWFIWIKLVVVGAAAGIGLREDALVPLLDYNKTGRAEIKGMRVEMIVTAYRESTAWISPMLSSVPNLKLRLFCKSRELLSDERCEYLPNIGQDHYVTLKYLVDNYENLPDILVYRQVWCL